MSKNPCGWCWQTCRRQRNERPELWKSLQLSPNWDGDQAWTGCCRPVYSKCTSEITHPPQVQPQWAYVSERDKSPQEGPQGLLSFWYIEGLGLLMCSAHELVGWCCLWTIKDWFLHQDKSPVGPPDHHAPLPLAQNSPWAQTPKSSRTLEAQLVGCSGYRENLVRTQSFSFRYQHQWRIRSQFSVSSWSRKYNIADEFRSWWV